MSCNFQRGSLIEFASGRPLAARERENITAHVGVCAACRQFLEEQTELSQAMTEFAAGTTERPPAEVESAVLSEFASRFVSSTFASRRRFEGLWLRVAAAVVLAAAAIAGLVAIERTRHAQPVASLRPGLPEPARQTSPPIVNSPVAAATAFPARNRAPKRRAPTSPASEAPFVAIPYTLPLDPRERATVMHLEMPVAALAAAGLTVTVPDPRASAQTDVIVGEDGRIRAIRLLSISTLSTSN